MSSEWIVPIVVALIMGPTVVILGRVRKENSDQHAEGRRLMIAHGVKIDGLGNKIDVVGSKLDGHLGWHKGRESQPEHAPIPNGVQPGTIVSSGTYTETATVVATS